MLPYITEDNALRIIKGYIKNAGVGTPVVANPDDPASATLEKIKIDDIVYALPSGEIEEIKEKIDLLIRDVAEIKD